MTTLLPAVIAPPGTEPTTPVRAPGFVADLAGRGDRTALVDATGPGPVTTATYAELAGRAAAVADRLGGTRRLVLVEARRTVDGVAGYLGALAGGHAVLLVAPAVCQDPAALTTRYRPTARVLPGSDGLRVETDTGDPGPQLHPDLALLLGTSGSTGSPRLVRLSYENVEANAAAVAASLGIRADDRAITTLPLHYCYGLSVLHSHLLRGAALVLSEASVADAGFWDVLAQQRVTSFAGVPYTFDLLDRVGFSQRRLPDLRYVTQAGGRLAPERVRRYAELGRRSGWDLVVMYGQTEATARMAWLPPDLAAEHPAAVGVAVPGGRFRVERDGGAVAAPGEIGEVVYSGPNVMLGYADTAADLARGRTVTELRTGDLGRCNDSGLLEIVGRQARFAKVFGLRVDLDRVDAALSEARLVTATNDGDDRLVVALQQPSPQRPGAPLERHRARAVAAAAAGLPEHAVTVVPVPQLPRLPSGKPDLPAVARLAEPQPAPVDTGTDEAALVRVYAELLARPDADATSTFVGLGGDSLSFVEVSVRLEHRLGRLPDDWPHRTVRELARAPAAPRADRPRWHWLETTVLLRAVAIVAIVGTHVGVIDVLGGAHVLLAAAGFGYARFALAPSPQRDRLRRQVRSVARIVVPSMAWIGLLALVTGAYSATAVLLLNGLVGPPDWSAERHFWFVEILAYLLVALLAATAVPWVDRAERRWPFPAALAVVAVGLVLRFGVVDLGWTVTLPVLWLFALGWAAARAHGTWQRLLVSAVAGWACWGFFADPQRDAVILAGVLALVWVRQLPCPRPLVPAVTVLAGASLYVYLTHWQLYPALSGLPGWAVVATCLVAGILAWQLTARIGRLLARVRAERGSVVARWSAFPAAVLAREGR